MRPADTIRDLFEQANIQADADQCERILGDALQELKQRPVSPPIRQRPSIWRILMESKTTQLSTAAVLLLALGLFFANLSETTVYAMPDVPALYKLANTLHLKGTRYFPENNSSQSTQIETWIDLGNNRWRSLSPSYTVANGVLTIYPTEQVYDDKGLRMSISHTRKQAGYAKLTRFQQALEQRRHNHKWHTTVFGDASCYDAYEVTGRETINGINYEIWEALVTEHSSATIKMKAWLDPSTGNLLKAKTWRLSEEDTWQLSSELDTIERNIQIPEGVFSMVPPAGYQLTNTPEIADPMPNRSVTIGTSKYTLTGYLLFALPDNSLIACWSSKYESTAESQAALFSDLQPGGGFPELPYRVHQMKAKMDDQEYVFPGCHLAATVKDGQYYEWGLYTSGTDRFDGRLTLRNFVVDYQVEGGKRTGNMWLQVAAVIETAQDFNELILAAMGEFSDEGTTPTLSLDEVLALAAQKRGK
jgi:outer membrane lipoprotein-sorting protein